MSILLNNHGYENDSWYQALSQTLPNQTIIRYDQVSDIEKVRDQIRYAVIWNHPTKDLQYYPNLKGILLLGAGTEHLENDSTLPEVPIVRLIDPEVLKDMGLYSLYWVMNHQRLYDCYRQQQRNTHWQRHDICQSQDYQVTVLGLGAVGIEVAQVLIRNGFNAKGWDASPRAIADLETYHGKQQLADALTDADTVVNCLPLNKGTQSFIDAELLGLFKHSTQLVNISRGAIIDDDALLYALDSDQLDRAILDVFAVEPLDQQSRYWEHPKVTVTPHMSGATYARSSAKLIAANILRIENAEKPFPLYQKRVDNH